jgi:hypothetical protein
MATLSSLACIGFYLEQEWVAGNDAPLIEHLKALPLAQKDRSGLDLAIAILEGRVRRKRGGERSFRTRDFDQMLEGQFKFLRREGVSAQKAKRQLAPLLGKEPNDAGANAVNARLQRIKRAKAKTEDRSHRLFTRQYG